MDEQGTIRATAWHPDLGNQPAQGRLQVSQWMLQFVSDELNVELPLQDLRVEVNDRDAERITFSHPSKRGWTIYTYDWDILEDPGLAKRTAIREQIHNIAAREQNWRKLLWITLGVFGAFMLIAISVFLVTGWTFNYLVSKVPPSFEKKLGDDALAELRAQVRFVQNSNEVRKVELLAKQFIPQKELKRFDFRFHIIDVNDPNAMALPGGNVLVTTGLLDLAEKPEELAGVLAHEIAHVTKRHGVKQVISTAGPYFLLKALLQSDGGFLGLIGHGSRMLITQNFSQKYETEADDVAWEYLTEANIDPKGFISFMRKLQGFTEKYEKHQVRVLSSHPPTNERVRRLESKLRKLEKKNDFVDLSGTGLNRQK